MIRIGLHIPETGAAPLPTNYRDSLDAIVQYFNAESKVYGRTFQVVIEDDGYDPEQGMGACKKLAGENVLIVIGHSMPAVEDECAAFFAQQGIPYMARGTFPSVLANRPLSWFATTTDDVQGRLLADYVIHKLNGAGQPSAVVFQNDQQAAKAAFTAEIAARGGRIVDVEQSVPRQADYSATVQKLQQSGAKFVMLSMPPVDAIKLSQQAQSAGYHPTWLGGGTWWNYNMVLETAGMALDGAVVLSPWASIDSAGAQQFKDVYRRYRPNSEPDDIGLVMWGWMMLAHQAIAAAGQNLSRYSFAQGLQGLRYQTPWWTPLAYTATDHRGTSSVCVFVADGTAKRWRQTSGFVSSF